MRGFREARVPAVAGVIVFVVAISTLPASTWASMVLGLLAAAVAGFLVWLVAGVLKFGDERRRE